MLTTTLALLAAVSGPMQVAPSSGGSQFLLVRADSAHTLFTPNASSAGRPGQIYRLPSGGFGVSTGGTSYYQTLGMPGGGGVAVPSGNMSGYIGSGGRVGVGQGPG